MKTKNSAKRALCMAVVMTVSGCRTPGVLGPGGGMSASEGSESGASSEGSESGASSDGSGSEASSEGSESGASSDGSKSEASSEGSGESSQSKSSGSSEEGSSHSESSDNPLSEESSRSSEEEGSSETSDGNSSNTANNDVASSVTVAVLVVGLGVVIWQAYAAEARRRGVAPREAGRAAQVYLRARTHQLREDLALGAGPTVEDLAAAARIRREHLGAFGRVLRANRKELLALAESSTLTPERALAWLERVGELARADPRLDEDRRAFLAAPAEEGAAVVAH